MAESLTGQIESYYHVFSVFANDPEILEKIEESLDIILFSIYHYRIENLCISFNGGKDCLVLLLLVIFTLKKLQMTKLNVLYIKCDDTFEEAEAFIHETVKRFPVINLCTIYNNSIKDGLWTYLSEHPHIKGIFIGVKKTDPKSNMLCSFQKTDQGWPEVMRIHPILNWSYKQIWSFILTYTSIGRKGETRPNSALASTMTSNQFRPAYELEEESQERLGR